MTEVNPQFEFSKFGKGGETVEENRDSAPLFFLYFPKNGYSQARIKRDE